MQPKIHPIDKGTSPSNSPFSRFYVNLRGCNLRRRTNGTCVSRHEFFFYFFLGGGGEGEGHKKLISAEKVQ